VSYQLSSPSATDIHCIGSKDALAWLRSLAGGRQPKALSDQEGDAALKMLMAYDRQRRAVHFESLGCVIDHPPAGVDLGVGEMDMEVLQLQSSPQAEVEADNDNEAVIKVGHKMQRVRDSHLT
jgi:hypothetical protein